MWNILYILARFIEKEDAEKELFEAVLEDLKLGSSCFGKQAIMMRSRGSSSHFSSSHRSNFEDVIAMDKDDIKANRLANPSSKIQV